MAALFRRIDVSALALCACGALALVVLGHDGRDVAIAAWSGAAGVIVQGRRDDDDDEGP